MKDYKYIVLYCFLALIGFSFLGCDDDGEPIPELLLKVDYFSGTTCENCYAFVSDENGNLLDVQKVDPTVPFMEFYGNTNGSVTLTTTIYTNFGTEDDPYEQYSFGTSQNIPKGTILMKEIYQETNVEFPDVIGTASFSLTNYTDYNEPILSTDFENGYGVYGLVDYSTAAYDGTTYKVDFNLRDDPQKVLAVSYSQGVPVYKWIENVNVGDELTVDFSTFEPSKTIPVNKYIAGGYIRSVTDNETGYPEYTLSRLDHWWLSQSSDKNIIPSMGYIDGFDKYFIYVNESPILCCEPSTNVTYEKLGELPTSIEIPDYEISINNSSITKFSYEFSNAYTYKDAYFSTRTNSLSISWSIAAPEGVPIKMPQIPNEILSDYPTFSIENLNFGFMNFYHHLDGYSYIDKINNKILFNDRQPFELLNYQIRD